MIDAELNRIAQAMDVGEIGTACSSVRRLLEHLADSGRFDRAAVVAAHNALADFENVLIVEATRLMPGLAAAVGFTKKEHIQ